MNRVTERSPPQGEPLHWGNAWRVVLPLLPWAALFLLMYVPLRHYGLSWLAYLVTVGAIAGLYIRSLMCRRRSGR